MAGYPISIGSKLIFSGCSQSGKTFTVLKLLLNMDKVFLIPPERIFISFTVWQDAYSQLERAYPDIKWSKSLPTSADVSWLREGGSKHSLIFIDDKISDISHSRFIEELFTTYSAHFSLTCILSTQNLFHKGSSWRSISLNATGFFLLASLRDLRQINTFANQLYGNKGHSAGFLYAFRQAVKSKCGYLYVDINPRSIQQYSLRSCILPNEGPIVVFRLRNM